MNNHLPLPCRFRFVDRPVLRGALPDSCVVDISGECAGVTGRVANDEEWESARARFVYDVKVLPFKSWTGRTSDKNGRVYLPFAARLHF